MTVYYIVFFITHHCNSAPTVTDVAAGEGIIPSPFFPRGGFGFSGGVTVFSLVFNFER